MQRPFYYARIQILKRSCFSPRKSFVLLVFFSTLQSYSMNIDIMRNLLYAYIALLAITILAGCNGDNHNKVLATTDSLLHSRPDSVLKLLDSLERNSNLSESELMHCVWNRAEAHHRMAQSMTEDTLLPRAVDYYRQRGDSDKILDCYLLEACYLKWTKQDSCIAEVLEKGLQHAIVLNDTIGIIKFYRGMSEIYYLKNDNVRVVEQFKKILQYSDKLSPREHYSMIYSMAVSMFLINEPSSSGCFEQSIDMALAAGDTASACHFLRNYADCLVNNGNYNKSIELIQRVRQLMPAYDNHSALQTTLTWNYINLHQLDSARKYWNKAWNIEQRAQAEGRANFATRAWMVQLKSVLDYTSGTPLDIITFTRFGDSIMREVWEQKRTIEQQLNMRNKLQQQNHELIINREKTKLHVVIASVFLIAVGTGLCLYMRNRKKRLAEAEERIDALTRLLNDAQRVSDDSSQDSQDSFFKKILLQQLGIIRLVANTPTSQNQSLLKLISGISNNEIPVDGLLVWVDLYPIIDNLYDGFYACMMEKYGSILSDKEVQICCLLCANFSTKEIGVVTQQTSATIYVRKTSIRKKIGVEEKQDIVAYIRCV